MLPLDFGSTGCEGALEPSLPPDFGDDGTLEQYDDAGLPVVPPGFGTR